MAVFLPHRLFAPIMAGYTPMNDVWPAGMAAAGGLFLLAGLWTPLAGAFVAITELLVAFLHPSEAPASLLAVAVSGALALLGPGAWSLDARIYGRKRIAIEDRT
jgi:putative oxidoreductase